MADPRFTPRPSRVKRRVLLAAAGWAAPSAAISVSAPAIAASGGGEDNGTANYYWDSESQGTYTRLDPATSGLSCEYSTQISYRADPWVEPPANGVLVVRVTFSQEVELDEVPSGWAQELPAVGGSAESYVFTLTPSAYGSALTFRFFGEAPGRLDVDTFMGLRNGAGTTWSTTDNADSTTLVE